MLSPVPSGISCVEAPPPSVRRGEGKSARKAASKRSPSAQRLTSRIPATDEEEPQPRRGRGANVKPISPHPPPRALVSPSRRAHEGDIDDGAPQPRQIQSPRPMPTPLPHNGHMAYEGHAPWNPSTRVSPWSGEKSPGGAGNRFPLTHRSPSKERAQTPPGREYSASMNEYWMGVYTTEKGTESKHKVRDAESEEYPPPSSRSKRAQDATMTYLATPKAQSASVPPPHADHSRYEHVTDLAAGYVHVNKHQRSPSPRADNRNGVAEESARVKNIHFVVGDEDVKAKELQILLAAATEELHAAQAELQAVQNEEKTLADEIIACEARADMLQLKIEKERGEVVASDDEFGVYEGKLELLEADKQRRQEANAALESKIVKCLSYIQERERGLAARAQRVSDVRAALEPDSPAFTTPLMRDLQESTMHVEALQAEVMELEQAVAMIPFLQSLRTTLQTCLDNSSVKRNPETEINNIQEEHKREKRKFVSKLHGQTSAIADLDALKTALTLEVQELRATVNVTASDVAAEAEELSRAYAEMEELQRAMQIYTQSKAKPTSTSTRTVSSSGGDKHKRIASK